MKEKFNGLLLFNAYLSENSCLIGLAARLNSLVLLTNGSDGFQLFTTLIALIFTISVRVFLNSPMLKTFYSPNKSCDKAGQSYDWSVIYNPFGS